MIEGDTCGARMVSEAMPGHTHVCGPAHRSGDHLCAGCGRYFWHAQEKLVEVVLPGGARLHSVKP